MSIVRFVGGIAVGMALTLAGVSSAAAQNTAPKTAPAAQTAAPAAKAAPAAATPQYREFVMGDPKATVTVIEYASLTCSHCAHFHQTAYPELKKNYIDTGKIRFVFRDFPLDTWATAGALLARCAPGDRGTKLIDLIFKNQDTWIRSEKPMEPLRGYAQLAGMSTADVDACFNNNDILKNIRDVQNTAQNLYKVQSTPTFFIEDEKVEGDRGYEYMAKIIDQKLKDKAKK
ncbi:MAG: DsbA family protein [Rhodospirillaceae bacterium]|nr:DsbA family protein [Rhodospirillaceae bacterium]